MSTCTFVRHQYLVLKEVHRVLKEVVALEEVHRILVKKVVSEMEVVVGLEEEQKVVGFEEQEMVVSASLQQIMGMMVLVMEDLFLIGGPGHGGPGYGGPGPGYGIPPP